MKDVYMRIESIAAEVESPISFTDGAILLSSHYSLNTWWEEELELLERNTRATRKEIITVFLRAVDSEGVAEPAPAL